MIYSQQNRGQILAIDIGKIRETPVSVWSSRVIVNKRISTVGSPTIWTRQEH